MNNKKISFCKKTSAAILSFTFFALASAAHALPFTIAIKAGTQQPTQINANTPYIAYYTISNETSSQRNSNFIKYLPPNVLQITSGNPFFDPESCDSTFNLAPKGQAGDSCTLQVLIQGAVTSQVAPPQMLLACFPNGVSCAGTNFPLNVTQTADRSHAYYINSGGSIGLSSCDLQMNGGFGACSSNVGGSFSDPMFITLNSTRNNLYVLNGSSAENVVSCPIQSDGSVSTCVAANLGISTPEAIAINPKNTVAYISFGNGNQLNYYNLNADGTLGTLIGAIGYFEVDVQGLAVNPAGSYLYAAALTGNEVCFSPINADGSVGTCEDTGATNLNSPQFIAFNHLGTYAYIANGGSGLIRYCSVNGDGSFGACNTASSDFTDPISIGFNQSGTYAYVVDHTKGSISSCPVRSDGSFGTCTVVASGINTPNGIAVS